MQVATTLQFRKAVRKYAAKKGIKIYDSYTNGGMRKDGKPARTVGFMISSATPTMAEKIEKKLNKKGLTAKTRCTGEGYCKSPSGVFYRGSHTYIRGTCVLAD